MIREEVLKNLIHLVSISALFYTTTLTSINTNH
jgi:hypothetical protein